jgi:hypothetical protein
MKKTAIFAQFFARVPELLLSLQFEVTFVKGTEIK